MAGILIVDDHQILRAAIGRLLTLSGHVVFEAGSVAEATTVLEAEHVDVVLTDLRMPGGGEPAFVEKLVRGPVPVIVMSGSLTSLPEVRDELRALGVTNMIEKPFGLDQLLCVLNPILDRKANKRVG